MTINKPTFIDLFCGCGGFSLGLKQAGLVELAAIDFNPEAITVFKKNIPDTAKVLERDLTTFPPEELAKIIGIDHVDVIVGGPPCQGFSHVRQVDGANSGNRLVDDDRRFLYKEFLKYVKFFRPKMFVMENVLGIRSAAGGEFFTDVLLEARKSGYRVHGEVIKAWEFGIPQKRERQLIFGTELDLPVYSSEIYMTKNHHETDKDNDEKREKTTLGEAIGDLPPLEAGQGTEISNYDIQLRQQHYEQFGKWYLNTVLEITKAKQLTAHRARPHNDRDLRDFVKIREGEHCSQALARGEILEFPYNRDSFKDRYTRQSRDSLCSTIVAHLSKDGLMFIHPTQNRTLTPREVARIQSFPDWFEFPVARTHQYRLIGNAVPPLFGKSLGEGILQWLMSNPKPFHHLDSNLTPNDNQQALEWILKLIGISPEKLSKTPKEQFNHSWFSVNYFYSHLHPDFISDKNDSVIQEGCFKSELLGNSDIRLIRPCYKRSGWPLILIPIVMEAKRRYINGELDINDYYCFGLKSFDIY